MKKFIIHLFLMTFLLTGHAASITEADIQDQENDQQRCTRERTEQCMQVCQKTNTTDCSQLCEENSKNNCKYAGE